MIDTSAENRLISFKNWSVSFSEANGEILQAISSLNLDIGEGESIGIVGESGSGKSMTALSIMQLLPRSAKTDGDIIWNGKVALHSATEEQLQKLRGGDIGMIFQEPLSSLNPVMRCGQQVVEQLIHHQNCSGKEALRLTMSWFSKVQLNDPKRVADSYPHQLSGGQRQRVMIAMALCTSPKLLIADEPTTALDVTVQYAILKLINELVDELGIAVIFISHDLAVVRRIAKRVIIMRKGEMVESGLVKDVFKNPKHTYTKGLLACHPPLNKRLKRLATVKDFTARDESEHDAFLAGLVEPVKDLKERHGFLADAPAILVLDAIDVTYVKSRNWLGGVTEQLKAVNKISFSLKRGECLGVVGESGSGKTTLGKSILRLVNIENGSIFFDNKDITNLPRADFRRIQPKLQMVFQDPFNSLNPKLKIGDLLREPLLVHYSNLTKAEQDARMLDVIKQVGLDESVLSRYPKAFSGGQRQRIGIARALLLEPEVLICDESVSALDVSVQAQVLNLIKSLQRKYGFSLIFISHDLSVIKFIADRILVMKEGEMIELAETETLFSDPKEEYTKQLIGAILT